MNENIIIEFKSIEVPLKAVRKRLGYPSGMTDLGGEAQRIFDEELSVVSDLLEPKGVYTRLQIRSNENSQLRFKNTEFTVNSEQVCKMLKTSEIVTVFMATIGRRLETRVKELMDAGEMARGVILDAIGSETADEVADRMHRDILSNLARESGMIVTPRFSPGYGDWPVSVQNEFAAIAGGDQIGIQVTESSLMVPRKSVSAIVGFKKK